MGHHDQWDRYIVDAESRHYEAEKASQERSRARDAAFAAGQAASKMRQLTGQPLVQRLSIENNDGEFSIQYRVGELVETEGEFAFEGDNLEATVTKTVVERTRRRTYYRYDVAGADDPAVRATLERWVREYIPELDRGAGPLLPL